MVTEEEGSQINQKKGGLAYVTLRDGIEFESVIDTLLRKKQYRVEVYAPKPGKSNGWDLVKRVCTRLYMYLQ